MISERKKRYFYIYNFQFLFNSIYFNQINIVVYQWNTFNNFTISFLILWIKMHLSINWKQSHHNLIFSWIRYIILVSHMTRLDRQIRSTVRKNNILQSLNYRGGCAPPTSRCRDFFLYERVGNCWALGFLIFWSSETRIFLNFFLIKHSNCKK